MNSAINKLTTEQHLPWFAALLSVPLVIWMMVASYGSINVDGILYIEVAKKFAVGEWKQGFALYNWPFYSLLIAGVHKLTHLSFEFSAHCLDTLFFALLTAGLLTLVRDVGGDRRVMISATVLLFACESIVRTYVPMVLRDPGFWAFHVWSVVFFLRLLVRHQWKDVLAWSFAASIATLFRIEGMSYLVVLPMLILFTKKQPEKAKLFFKANSLVIVGVLGLMLAILFYPSLHIREMGRLSDPLALAHGTYQQFAHGLVDKAHTYAATVLGKFISSYAFDGLVLTLLYILVIKASTTAGWLQLLLAVYARKSLKYGQLPISQKVFGWLIAITLTHAACMLLSNFLLPKRYLMPLGFVIIVYASFGLSALYAAWKQRPLQPVRENWKFPLAVAILGIQMGMMLWIWPAKKYELNAANWAMTHAAGGRIYADSARLRYYADTDQPFRRDNIPVEEIEQLFSTGQISQYAYLLVHTGGERQALSDFMEKQRTMSPQATFGNGRDRIVVYRLMQ